MALGVAACGNPGFAFDDPWEIFWRGNGEAALSEAPSKDLADYLPALEPDSGASRSRPTSIVAGSIAAVKEAFGFRHTDGPTSGAAVPFGELNEGDFRVVELTVAPFRVVADSESLERPGARQCVLMMLGDARAALSDVEALIGQDDAPTWFPLSMLDEHAGAYGSMSDPVIAPYRRRGCVALFDNSVLRPAPSGKSVERLGSWRVTIDRLDGRPLQGWIGSYDALVAAVAESAR